MRSLRVLVVAGCLAASLAMVPSAEQGQAPAPGGRGQAGGPGAGPGGAPGGGGRAAGAQAAGRGGAPIGGTLTPAKADERGWGWQVKASVSPATPRPFYNKAKELLFQDKQITSYTISTFNPELYCEVAKHFDYIWFEMQHSTMSYDEVRRMILTCPGAGAAPVIGLPK